MDHRQKQLTVHEYQLLREYLTFYRSLDDGRIVPRTPAQSHFVDVCRCEAMPTTDHEIAYCKYKTIRAAGSDIPRDMPKKGETCAIASPSQVKRAALLFDRVHVSSVVAVTDPDVPKDKVFCCDLGRFVWKYGEGALSSAADHVIDQSGLNPEEYSEEEWDHVVEHLTDSDEFRRHFEFFYLSEIICKLENQSGATIIPVLEDVNVAALFTERGCNAYIAVLSHIPIVSTDLPWDQVGQFVADKEALRKYQSLRLWIRKCKNCESQAHLQETIEKMIDDYAWAIRKHRLTTTIGAVSSLSAAASGGAILNLLGTPLGELLYAGLPLLGGVTAWVADRLVALNDVYRGENSEIAVIYDLQRRFGDRKGGSEA